MLNPTLSEKHYALLGILAMYQVMSGEKIQTDNLPIVEIFMGYEFLETEILTKLDEQQFRELTELVIGFFRKTI